MAVTPRTSRPKHAPGAARTPFALLMLGLVGGGMAALLALNTASAANEVRRHDLADSDQGVAASLVQLQNQVRSSAAPDNLAAAAAAAATIAAEAMAEIGAARGDEDWTPADEGGVVDANKKLGRCCAHLLALIGNV